MTPAELLLNNAGEVDSFEMGKVTEAGIVKDALFSWVDVKDPKAADKIKNDSIRWTSPWFTSFTDGRGHKWNGVIGHLALTSRPRITNQQPFQAAFSLTPHTPSPAELTGICLSRAGLVTEIVDGEFLPDYPVAFSLWTGAKFAFPEDMKKKSKKGDEDEGSEGTDDAGGKKSKKGKEDGGRDEDGGGIEGEGGGETGTTAPKFDSATGEPIKQPLVDPDGDISVWTVVADMLSSLLGVDIGEDVTEENGLEKVYEVLRQAMKDKMAQTEAGPEAAATETTPPPETGSSNPIVQEQQPMFMSLEQANAISDPTMKSIALSLVSAQKDAANEKKRNEAIRNKLFKDAGISRAKRIAAVSRYMGPEEKKQLEELASGAQFSLGDDGSINDPIDSWLSILEKQQKFLPALLKTPGAELSVQPQPEETTAAVSAERLKKVSEEFERNAGVV